MGLFPAIDQQNNPIPFPCDDVSAPLRLLAHCPEHKPTPLFEQSALAAQLGIKKLSLKYEAPRMNLGSFKALGAAYVIANDAQKQAFKPLTRKTYVTASAGNHGLSLAMGAKIFGARAVIYLSKLVPQAFAARLEQLGARVVIAGEDYQASMDAALSAAEQNHWTLVSDSSWAGYYESPRLLMQGYLVLAHEITEAMSAQRPSHIFLQAGVGGLACATAAYLRKIWGASSTITVVEPSQAPALIQGIKAARVVDTSGGASNMGRLDCKTASAIALNGLARDADYFMTIDDASAQAASDLLQACNLPTTPSGAAGLAGLTALTAEQREQLGIDGSSSVLLIISEGAE